MTSAMLCFFLMNDPYKPFVQRDDYFWELVLSEPFFALVLLGYILGK